MAKQSSPFSRLISGNFDSLVASLAGFLFIYFYARHGGIGISPDSVVYISTAGNIHDHGTIKDFTGLPMMDFPAFYPMFLAGVMWLTGLSCVQFGTILNGLLFALLIWLCGWLMQRFTCHSRIYKWVMLCLIVLSPCLLGIYSMLWSETIFLVLLLLFVISAGRYFRGDQDGAHRTSDLIRMSLIAALACVTRYAGVTFIGMGLMLMLCDMALPIRRKTGHILLFAGISSTLFVLNLFRNRLVTGTMTGYREKGLTAFSVNLHDYGSVFCDWLPFLSGRYGAASFLGWFFLFVLTGIFVFRLFKKRALFSYENIALSYFIVYSVFILFTATVSRFQTLDSRLLCPLFLPWIWGSSSWIPAVFSRLSQPLRTGFQVVAAAAALCIGWGEWRAHLDNWVGIKDAGIPGYTEDSWQKSELIEYIRSHRSSLGSTGTIYSNAFEGLWFLAGVRSDLTPHRDMPDDIRDMMIADHFTVISFDDAENEDLITVEYIERFKLLKNSLRFKDGTIFFFATDPSRKTQGTAH